MAFTYTIRKDGRLMKRVSVNGRIKSIYADNPKELEKQYIELKHLSNKGIVADDEKMTVAEWSNKWVELYKSDKELATIKMYKDAIRLYIVPSIGNIQLHNLKQSDIVNMLNALDKRNITRKKDIALLTIKQILNKAVENDYIYKNVANGIKQKRHKAAEKEPLNDDTINKIKELSKTNFNAFMILFLIYTGLRREEIVPLQYKDINIEEKYILINKAVHFEKNQPIIKNTKNAEARRVPIFDVLYYDLKRLKETHKNNDYVFPNTLGNIASETSLRIKLNNVLKLLNDNSKISDTILSVSTSDSTEQNGTENQKENKIKFTLHQLRHTYVCILHKAGIDLKQAQLWTGHKDVKVLLNIYTHLDAEDNQKSIDKVNEFLA